MTDSTPPDAWATASLTKVIEHILGTHHAFTREKISHVLVLADKVVRLHGGEHIQLREIQRLTAALARELDEHLQKEERMLFPYITELEATTAKGKIPDAPFAALRDPIGVMDLDHRTADQLFAKIKRLTRDFTPPRGASEEHATFYGQLKELDADLQEHMRIESDLLFPRALELDEEKRSGT